MSPKRTTTLLTAITALTCLLVAVPETSYANKTPRSGKATQYKQKTKNQVVTLRRQALRQQRRKVSTFARQMNGVASVAAEQRANTGIDIANQPRGRAVLNRLINEHGQAKAEYNRTLRQSYTQFAATRLIEIVPAPPREPPPPLPKDRLAAPGSSISVHKSGIRETKTRRPTGGPVTVVRRMDF